MEWIIYGFFGIMGVIVATIIGAGAWRALSAKEGAQGPMGSNPGDHVGRSETMNHIHQNADSGSSGGGFS